MFELFRGLQLQFSGVFELMFIAFTFLVVVAEHNYKS